MCGADYSSVLGKLGKGPTIWDHWKMYGTRKSYGTNGHVKKKMVWKVWGPLKWVETAVCEQKNAHTNR